MARTAPKLGGGSATLDGGAFEARFNMPLVHEAVRAAAAGRQLGHDDLVHERAVEGRAEHLVVELVLLGAPTRRSR